MIKAVIIDDDLAMRELNSQLLSGYFPEIELRGVAHSIETAYDLILNEEPDLVLLDIELSDGNCFQLLQKLRPYNFKVVFITGFNSFGIKAIKFSACDYILKPVNEVEFQQAIQAAIALIKKEENIQLQSQVLMDSLSKNAQSKKLILRTSDSMHVIDISDIYYCKSDNSYTTFYFQGPEKILVSKSLKEYESMLSTHQFFRAHQRFLVNLNHIKKVDKTDGHFIIMKNDKEIPVSVRQVKKLITSLENL